MTQQEFFERYKYSVKADRIGGGGFGTVYRATDRLLHCKVAIKVSEVKIIGDKEFSLKTEFEAVKRMDPHPNIATYKELYSFEEHNGVFDYAVMQYYEDGNLKNLIDRGVLTMAQKEDIAVGILDGIAFLHRNKVVHRDLKPANILICREGDDYVPLITDFGLSKGVEEMSKSGFSNSIAGGSPGYMSPEQIKGGRMQLNTDLWSYGVMVYELFSGRRLFQSESQSGGITAVHDMILRKDISAEIAALPGKWRDVAERCLVRDSRLRAKSADELYSMINGGDDDEVTVVDDPKPNPPKPKPTPQPEPMSTWLYALCSLFSVLVFYGVAFGIRSCHDNRNKLERIVARRESYERRKGFEYKTFSVNGVSFEMVAVQGGTFTMGATPEQGSDGGSDEFPTHSVTLDDYYIGKFEVTEELWDTVMGSYLRYSREYYPVESVSWYGAVVFCNRLSEKTGRRPYYSIDKERKDSNNENTYDDFKWTVGVNPGANGFRLPTEAEWEYAARGGSKSRGYKYSGSDDRYDVAWYDGNSEVSANVVWNAHKIRKNKRKHAVGTKSPNELGIYDMSGNVYEWCQDWDGSYGSGSQTNPQGPSSGSWRVSRGGCWRYDAQCCRVSYRHSHAPYCCFDYLGFRLAVSQ